MEYSFIRIEWATKERYRYIYTTYRAARKAWAYYRSLITTETISDKIEEAVIRLGRSRIVNLTTGFVVYLEDLRK